jgi:Tc toxin complex TcA C-terminal TcB-binding domain
MTVAVKYLSEFYTFKAYLPGNDRIVIDPTTKLEYQIQAHILLGNQYYQEAKYSRALDEYLKAWGLIPVLVYPYFPWQVSVMNPDVLLKLDLTEELLSASIEIHRFGDLAEHEDLLGVPGEIPAILLEVSKNFGVPPVSAAELHYDRGITFAKIGQNDQAEREFRTAREVSQENQDLKLRVMAATAALAVLRGKYQEAQTNFERAFRVYSELGHPEKAAGMLYNSGAAQTLGGDAAGAAERFVQAASTNPFSLPWTVTHTTNPGIASFQRPVGVQGLPLVLQKSNGTWTSVATGKAQDDKKIISVLKDGGALQIDLANDGLSAMREQLLESRINATTIAQLQTHYWIQNQFVSYLAHVSEFVLPMSLGDTYSQLGDFQVAAAFYMKVRDYRFLNQAIERPMAWSRLARTYLRLGNRKYRDRDMTGARAQFENIVKIVNGVFELSGPLYTGGFSGLVIETRDFLNSQDHLSFTGFDYLRRSILLEALANINQILNNINFLGFPEDIVPIHSWRYLQNLARYFANQAIQMERNYINFKNAAEQDEANRLLLEQNLDASAAATAVEEKRVNAAEDQRYVAELGVEAAQTRLDNAEDRRDDYNSTSKKLAILDEISAWATGPMDKAAVNAAWAGALGISPGEYDTYHVTQFASSARSKISSAYELRNMDRQVDEMIDAKSVADAQVTTANSMVEVAKAQKELAQLRQQQAQAQLENFNAQEFTPELWTNLAEAQLEISQRYLNWAISAAFLMERAFEFEYDVEINRIRFDYSRSELNGLFSGDFLLADIDQFSFDRLIDTQKKLPAKIVISLADRYPFQFFQQFQRTGRLEFDTLLEDFDRMHPGMHLAKLRRLEVIVEGLIGRQGAQGILRNSGFSYFRGRDGFRKLRLQKPESILLSLYDLRRDGFIFTSEEGLLHVFENSGLATGWSLEFPPDSNDLDYHAISNIHLVLYFDAYYSQKVANLAMAELEAGAIYQQTLGVALRFQFPDEFFSFQDTGEVTFQLGDNYVPVNQVDPKILELQLVVKTEEGVSNSGLVVTVRSMGTGLDLNQTTDESGMIATDSSSTPLNSFRGKPLLDAWTVKLDRTLNEAAFAAGFSWEKITNFFLNVEYEYIPRGRPLVTDDFVENTLSRFDVIDDAAATGGPSAWAHAANLGGSIVQTSNISGSPLTADPSKPGTYLVRKTSTDWPDLQDLVVISHVLSGDEDALGLVFRYQDPDNFYFFLMDRQRGYRRIGKKIAGVFQELDKPSVQSITPGYELNRTYEVSIAVVGEAIAVFLDGVHILTGRDSSLIKPGRIGLYAWSNIAANFLDLSFRRA